MRNIGLIVAAVVVLVVGFVLVQGAGDDDGSPTSAGVTTTQETAPPAASTPTEAPATTTEAAPEPAPEPEVPTVTFADGKVEGGVQKLSFDKGDQVEFKVRSDVADEVHVHGFDVMKDVAAGGSVTFAFEATIDGAYEVELEGSGTQLATLEIQP
jgi:hypothetical protein